MADFPLPLLFTSQKGQCPNTVLPTFPKFQDSCQLQVCKKSQIHPTETLMEKLEVAGVNEIIFFFFPPKIVCGYLLDAVPSRPVS